MRMVVLWHASDLDHVVNGSVDPQKTHQRDGDGGKGSGCNSTKSLVGEQNTCGSSGPVISMLGRTLAGLRKACLLTCCCMCVVLSSHQAIYDNRNEYVPPTLPYLAEQRDNVTISKLCLDAVVPLRVACNTNPPIPEFLLRVHERGSRLLQPFPRSCILFCMSTASDIKPQRNGQDIDCGLQEDLSLYSPALPLACPLTATSSAVPVMSRKV